MIGRSPLCITKALSSLAFSTSLLLWHPRKGKLTVIGTVPEWIRISLLPGRSKCNFQTREFLHLPQSHHTLREGWFTQKEQQTLRSSNYTILQKLQGACSKIHALNFLMLIQPVRSPLAVKIWEYLRNVFAKGWKKQSGIFSQKN